MDLQADRIPCRPTSMQSLAAWSALPAGAYYFNPVERRLILITGGACIDPDMYDFLINRPVFDSAAFAIFFVAQLQAIEPLYGDHALSFATIETGLMTQLLELCAPAHGIGLCQIGMLETEPLRGPLGIESEPCSAPFVRGRAHHQSERERATAGGFSRRVDGGRDLNAAELLRSLRAEGVQLWCEGEKLRYRAPKGRLAAQLIEALASCKAEIIDLLQKPAVAAAGPCFQAWSPPTTRSKDYPLSSAQQRMWFLRQLEPESCALNVTMDFLLSGALDVPALQRSLNELVARHEAFRTTCSVKNGVPLQVIAPTDEEFNTPLEVIDLRTIPRVRAASRAAEVGKHRGEAPVRLGEPASLAICAVPIGR